MKLYRQARAILLLACAVIGCNQNPASDTTPEDDPPIIEEPPISSWKYIGPPDNFKTATSLGQISFTLSKTDAPYIAFWDGTNGGRASVMRWNGSSWQYVGQPGFTSSGYSTAISLALNSADQPYLAILRLNDGGSASVMRLTGSVWEYVGQQEFSPPYPMYLSLTLSSNGLPYVSYTVDSTVTNQGRISVRYNSLWQTNWFHVGTPALTVEKARTLSLSLSPGDNIPYIAFSDGTKNGKISVMQKGLSTWSYLGTPGFSTGEAFYTSIKVSSTGTPYVAFKDYTNGGRASVMRWNGSSWQYVGQPGFTTGSVGEIAFAVSNENVPYLAFKDYANSGKLSVMQWNGSTWQFVGQPGIAFVNEWSGSIHLALTSKGAPCVASKRDFLASVLCFEP
jgi:hypothetical protein